MSKLHLIKAFVKQVTPRKDRETSKNILNWNSEGQNNDFPQYLLKLIDKSPTAHSLSDTFHQYLKGDGIIDHGGVKMNESQNLNGVLDDITGDYSRLFGYCFKMNFSLDLDGPKLQVLNAVPFEHTRIGINEEGFVSHIVYNPTFGHKDYEEQKSVKYHLFSDNKEKLIQEMNEPDYKGHVIWRAYQKPGHRHYPYSPLASAIDWVGCDGEIQHFHYNNISSGFLLKAIMTVFGDPDGAAEEGEDKNGNPVTLKTNSQALEEHIKNTLMGSDGYQLMVQWIQNKEEAPTLQTFNPNTYDGEYREIQEMITEELARVMQIPTQLANINSNTALNQSGDLLSNAVYLMHSRVQSHHDIIASDLQRALKFKGIEEIHIKHYFPFPDDRYLDKAWETMTTEERREFIKTNTNYINDDIS